jgi:hypothetical protein
VAIEQPLKQHLKREIAETEITRMLEQNIIVPACSPWNSHVVLVTRLGKDPRFCLYYRGLNEVTVKR